ncbi:response regulator transcription factor [Streptomyces sp. NPDC000888]
MRRMILIVEDDHALRDVLMRGLRDEDFDTVPAPDGAAALRLATTAVSAVVLDIGLPDADGRDVCQAMRANGFLSPVMTAHHRLSGFSAGGDDYLSKPFHLTELAARLRAALKRAAPQQAPAAELVPCGWATAGKRIVQVPVVAHLAHRQGAGAPAVYDAVGGQLGHDQGDIRKGRAARPVRPRSAGGPATGRRGGGVPRPPLSAPGAGCSVRPHARGRRRCWTVRCRPR